MRTEMSELVGIVHHVLLEEPPVELIYGAFSRLVLLVYAAAFASLLPQMSVLASANKGVSPLNRKLARLRELFPNPLIRFAYMPSLFWLLPVGRSDFALHAVPATGLLVALAGATSGLTPPVPSQVAHATCYFLYLSCDLPVEMWLPWDSALLEAGVLCALLPGFANSGRGLALQREPHVAVRCMLHVFLARLMLGFARTKFWGERHADRFYIRDFFGAIPIPSRIALWAHCSLPPFMFTLLLRFMWVAEIPAPLMALVPGVPRIVACAVLVALQIGIVSAGCFGHFNVLTAALCVPLLDSQVSLADAATEWDPETTLLVVYLLLGLVQVQFGAGLASWSYCLPQMLAPSRVQWIPLPHAAQRAVLVVFRLLAPWRLVNCYGVFPVHAFPPIKCVPVVEVVLKGEDVWRVCRWRYLPTDARTYAAPWFLTMHTPRLELKMYFAARGIYHEGFAGSVLRGVSPVAFAQEPLPWRLARALLEGSDPLLRYFRLPASSVAGALGDTSEGGETREGARSVVEKVRVRLALMAPSGSPYLQVPASAASFILAGPQLQDLSGMLRLRGGSSTHHLLVPELSYSKGGKVTTSRWLEGRPSEVFHFDAVAWRRSSPMLEPDAVRARALSLLDDLPANAQAIQSIHSHIVCPVTLAVADVLAPYLWRGAPGFSRVLETHWELSFVAHAIIVCSSALVRSVLTVKTGDVSALAGILERGHVWRALGASVAGKGTALWSSRTRIVGLGLLEHNPIAKAIFFAPPAAAHGALQAISPLPRAGLWPKIFPELAADLATTSALAVRLLDPLNAPAFWGSVGPLGVFGTSGDDLPAACLDADRMVWVLDAGPSTSATAAVRDPDPSSAMSSSSGSTSAAVKSKDE